MRELTLRHPLSQKEAEARAELLCVLCGTRHGLFEDCAGDQENIPWWETRYWEK